MRFPATIGALRRDGYTVQPVKDEIRYNLIRKLEIHEPLFPGIIGYDQTVVPSLVNAILARHDILLLGLRGQAKSRIVRQLPSLLDENIPFIKGCEINDNPYKPACKRCAILVGDRTVAPRICDLAHALPGMTGKVELVFEGEQEGPAKVSKALTGKAVREGFTRTHSASIPELSTRRLMRLFSAAGKRLW